MNEKSGYASSPVLAELYDFVPRYANRQDATFYVGQAVSCGGKVLELGCGTGRIMIPIAKAGVHIYGLDSSEHMLAVCRRKLQILSEEQNGRIHIVHGDMTDFNLEVEFDLAIVPFRAFQHLVTTEQQLGCLQSIRRNLSAGGKVIIDFFNVDYSRINNRDYMEESAEFTDAVLPDGRRLGRSSRFAGLHPAEQYNDVELIYYLTDTEGQTKRIVHSFQMRYFFRYEVEHLFSRTGFDLVQLFGNFDQSPLADESPEMIFVAQKA